MSDRERIFAGIRDAITPIKEKTGYPEVDPKILESAVKLMDGGSWEDFKRNFTATHGRWLESTEAIVELLDAESATEGYIDPVLLDKLPTALQTRLKFHTTIDRTVIDRYQFGITRAHAAIAETGTIVLRDSDTPDRLGALSPWVHIAIIERASLLKTVSEGIAQLGDDPNIIWVTGPSKTADVEGILIEGVHGPGIQACLVI